MRPVVQFIVAALVFSRWLKGARKFGPEVRVIGFPRLVPVDEAFAVLPRANVPRIDVSRYGSHFMRLTVAAAFPAGCRWRPAAPVPFAPVKEHNAAVTKSISLT